MGTNNREIETKLLVHNSDLSTVNLLLSHLVNRDTTKILFGSSKDTYWSLPYDSSKFVRARERDGICQMTVKVEDKGHSINRVEIDLSCTSDIKQIIEYNKAILGEPVGVIEKTYYVYWVGESDTICCYDVRVDGVQQKEIIVEVECDDEENMTIWVKKVLAFFELGGMNIDNAPGSLWNMYLSDLKLDGVGI